MSATIGIVRAKQANFYRVHLPGEVVLLCTSRSRLKKTGERVMVGDRVTVEEINQEVGQGVITAIAPRTTAMARPPIANATQVLLLFAIEAPPLDPWQLSRFLVCSEATAMRPCLCLNKCDLVSQEVQTHWQQRLAGWGYPPILLSVEARSGYNTLLPQLAQQTTLLAGPSGVGKSSLIRSLIPDVAVRVAAVSGKLHRGRHTTRHVELFELPSGGLLADSPGFNQPDLVCAPADLANYFPEIRARLQGEVTCQFKDCQHHEEPGCVVRGDWERYDHYLSLLMEVTETHQQRQQQAHAEAAVKLKMTQGGQAVYEPRLASKQYRRRSRRLRHQTLEQWQEGEEVTVPDSQG